MVTLSVPLIEILSSCLLDVQTIFIDQIFYIVGILKGKFNVNHSYNIITMLAIEGPRFDLSEGYLLNSVTVKVSNVIVS